MGIFDKIKAIAAEKEAEDLLRKYLEKQYNVDIVPRYRAFILCYKRRVFDFFYTLEEVRAYLEGEHIPFEESMKLKGFKCNCEACSETETDVKEEVAEAVEEQLPTETTEEIKEEK